MNKPDKNDAWPLFRFNWFVIAAILAAFGIGLIFTNFQVRPKGYLIVFSIAAIYGVFGYFNANAPQRRQPRTFAMLTAIAQMMLVVPAMASISYMTTAAGLPLQDANLLAMDRALGLDFRSYLDFANDRIWLVYILAWGYRAIFWPIWFIVVALPLFGHHRRAAEFICALSIALIITTIVSMVIPAMGVFGALGLTPADHPNIEPQAYYDSLYEIPAIRAGSLRTLDLFALHGLLTFPSFHAASAVLYAYALWPLRWLRLPNLLVNGAMMLATPIGGGHFFIDVLAGIVVAVGSIFVAQRISDILAMRAGRKAFVLKNRFA
jgi:hypothetical protein